jgi:hypothetical protein
MDKKEIISFLDKEETYNKVLSFLNDKCGDFNDYPEEYFIAGGSIANTLHCILNGGESPVINDLDLFYFHHTRQQLWIHSEPGDNFIQQSINQTINLDGYSRVWYGSGGEEIAMTNSERFGDINKITINVHLYQGEFNPLDYYKQLLNNFDLNCCAVGIDRVSKKIIYTKHFVDFLSHNRIEVISITHPLQTAVRMKKKSEELKTDTSNFKTEMSLIQHSFLVRGRNAIGLEWASKIKDYTDFIDEYFVFDDVRTENIATGEPTLFYYGPTNFILNPATHQFKFNRSQSLISFWDIFIRGKKENEKKSNELIKFYMEKMGLRVITDSSVRYNNRDLHSATSKKVNRTNFDPINAVGLSPNYLDCDFDFDDLRKVHTINLYFSENGVDPAIFLADTIKDHIKVLTYIRKRFMTETGLFKSGIFQKVINRSYNNEEKEHRITLGSLDYKKKINSFETLVNGLWIKEKWAYKYFFKNKPRSVFGLGGNVIDLNDMIEF